MVSNHSHDYEPIGFGETISTSNLVVLSTHTLTQPVLPVHPLTDLSLAHSHYPTLSHSRALSSFHTMHVIARALFASPQTLWILDFPRSFTISLLDKVGFARARRAPTNPVRTTHHRLEFSRIACS